MGVILLHLLTNLKMVCRGSMPLSNMFLNLVLFYSPFTFEEKTTLAGKQKQKASLIHVDLRKYLELILAEFLSIFREYTRYLHNTRLSYNAGFGNCASNKNA